MPQNQVIYVFCKNLEEAVQIMDRYRKYERSDWVFVDTRLRQYIRGGRRTIYFCGNGHERPDFTEARVIARSNQWELKDEMPPEPQSAA